MTFDTTHFGPVPADDSASIEFPAGLPGFESCRRFTLIQHPEQPSLAFLQSLERAELCFLALPAQTLRPDYHLAIGEEDLELLGLAAGYDPDEVVAFALLSVAEGEEPTANLLAPVLVRIAARRAVQSIQTGGRYSCREPLVAGEAVCS